MLNLLQEIIEIIKGNGKSTDEIKFVGCNWEEWTSRGAVYYEYYMTWDDFVSQVNRSYDDGYGSTLIKDNLQIVGKNWWLERHEYDGSEWWEFKSMPKKPKEYKKFSPFKYEKD